MSRRQVIGYAARAGIGVASLVAARGTWSRVGAQSPSDQGSRGLQIPSWKTELRQLAPHVFAYTQASGPGVDNSSLSNAGVIVGDDMMAIDALGPPMHAKSFIAAATEATSRPFGRVVNTHHHRDHTNGNCFFAPAEIVAHEFCRAEVIARGIPQTPYDSRPDWQEGMSELTLAPPTTTFTDRLTYHYGDTVIELIFNGPAHTWGDVMVYLPQHRILFAGDIAFWYVTPAAHNGHVTKWIEAIDRIMGMDVETIVPGHGPIGTKKELAETRAYLELMVREVKVRHARGMSPGEAAADLDMGRFAHWTNSERNVWNTVRLYAEFDGTLTPERDGSGGEGDPDGRQFLRGTDRAMEEYLEIRARRGR